MITIRKIRNNSFNGMIEPAEEGENILKKIRRIVDENEPLEDGAPLIYTPKKDGVKPEYDIRTSKWDIAFDAMDRVSNYKVSEYLKDDKVGDLGESETTGESVEKPNSTTDN